MEWPRAQSTVQVRVRAAEAGAANAMATKRAATLTAHRGAFLIIFSLTTKPPFRVRGNRGLEAETRY
jgi:hypothetical protein